MNFALLFFVVVVMVNCYIGTANAEKTGKNNPWASACRYTINNTQPEYLVRPHRKVLLQYPCQAYLCTRNSTLHVFTCQWHPTIKCRDHTDGKCPNCCQQLSLCGSKQQGKGKSSTHSLEDD